MGIAGAGETMHVSRGCWGREPQVGAGAAGDDWVWGKRSSGQGAPRAQRPARGSHPDTAGPAVSPAHVAPRGDLKLSVPPAPRPAWRRQPGLTRSSTTGAPALRNGEFGGTSVCPGTGGAWGGPAAGPRREARTKFLLRDWWQVTRM